MMTSHGPMLLLGIALIVGGIQFMAVGLLGELLARTYYESQNKPVYAVRDFLGARAMRTRRNEPPRTAGAAGR
jgi:hypothetical protein